MMHLVKEIHEEWQQVLSMELADKVRFDPVTLQLYSTAACIYEITPLAVVIPQSVQDIITTIQICRKYQIPVLPRGAGSGLSGSSVGRAVILDLTLHFKSISKPDNDSVKCDVGIVLNDLQDYLAPYGKKFGPDPSSGNVCVIGGMLGNNAGGPHTLQHGNTNRHVREISVVLANGKVFKAKNIKRDEIAALDEFHRPYYEKILDGLTKYALAIEKNRPKVTKNASGYQVWDVLTDEYLNMASLFVGSEGTLGVFTDAVLELTPVRQKRGMISLYFTELPAMGQAVQILRKMGASALEFVDQNFIKLALSFRPEMREFLPDHVRYLLYAEFEGDSESEVMAALKNAENQIIDKNKLAEKGASSTDEKEIERIFRLRKVGVGILNKIEGKKKPISFIEDSAIHPDRFPDFLLQISKLFERFQLDYVVLGHAGDGNLHIRPLVDLKDQTMVNQVLSFMEAFVQLVQKFEGTLTGEHGDGRLRTPYLKNQFPQLMPLFAEIKQLFDPEGLMNPDIIIERQPYRWIDNVRYTPDYSYVSLTPDLDREKWRMEIEKCHGCGTCREYCPVFVATGEEEATARAKANILRGLISGKIEEQTIDTDHFFKIMDYCLNCGQCLTDCPTAVDIPGMAVLAKERLHQKRPFKINELILQNGKLVSSLAAMTAALTNFTLRFPLIRQIMEKTAGIDKRRLFLAFNKLRKNAVQPVKTLTAGRKKVVLWSGCSAMYNDPHGEHVKSIEILNALGYQVDTPSWKCCNIAKLTYGNKSGALPDISYNLRILLPYAEQNIPVIFSSASCGYAFIKEYENYFPEREDVKKVAKVAVDLHDFLMKAYLRGEFKDKFAPLPMKIIYHEPCHLKSQQNEFGPEDLMKLIPELEQVPVEDSCCGIAGTFGMKKENYDLSMKIGIPLFEQIKKAEPEILVSGCGTCQIQLLQGTGIKTLHPIELLHRSYVKGKDN
jgi:FAD/FMN-containing dehydrogenase/Fe-S oxidoreductase